MTDTPRPHHLNLAAKHGAAGIPYSDMGEWAIMGWHQPFCSDPDGRVIESHQLLDPDAERR